MTRPPTAAPRPRHGSDPGFVLVGVLMFILILTILGLSLFSLSSFESQFFSGSLDQQRAFYSATGGIERAKFVLSTTGRLPDARNITGVPLDGLAYTVAKQGDDFASADSEGTVKWGGGAKPVWIRALAVIGGQRSMVEAQFTPNRGRSYYKQLFALSGAGLGLDVSLRGGPPFPPGQNWSASDQVYLRGVDWQNAPSTLPVNIGQPPPTLDLSGGVPTPDVTGYFSRYWNSAPTMPRDDPDDQYDFDAYTQNPADHVGFWRTPYSAHYDPSRFWSLSGGPSGTPAQIRVRGTCVWMFDHGVLWDRHVQVFGSGNDDDALVLVAHPGTNVTQENGRGIVFLQPLYSDHVPVILVCDGGVGDENTEDKLASSSVSYLTVFATTCGLIGPKNGGTRMMSLTHDPNAPQDTPVTGLIDRLSKKGYLPNTSGAGGDFVPIAGKWREIKDSDPIN